MNVAQPSLMPRVSAYTIARLQFRRRYP